MAQRAIIGINGDLLPFDETLDKIQTQGIGGGSVTWVPEADTHCTALTVTANGSKSASDEGVYGWDYVAVSVPGSSVTGIDPATGQETTVTVNPETGDIVKTVAPTEIRVTTLPTKTDYTNGETIDYSGIVVHAYSSTGQDMGEVPFNELVFPVTTAQGGDEWTDGAGVNAKMIYYVPSWRRDVDQQGHETETQVYCCTEELGIDENGRPCSYGGYAPGTLLATRFNGYNYIATISGSRAADRFSYFNGDATPYDYQSYGWRMTGGASGSTGDGKFEQVVFQNVITRLPVSTVNPDNKSVSTLHAIQSVPVQWSRPGDGAILETSFNINVTGGAA
jgi:hypothetical protein